MARFVLLALPLAALLLAGGSLLQEWLLPALPDPGLGPVRLGEWLLEALVLVALVLLAAGRGGRWWLDGLLVGGLAWVLRGPLLLLALARLGQLPRGPWAAAAYLWLGVDLAAAGLVAWLARPATAPGAASERPVPMP